MESAAVGHTEQALAGDHQERRSTQNAIKNLQGQFRVLESMLGGRIVEDHIVVLLSVLHAGSVISRRRIDKSGLTPYRLWKGRPFTRSVAEFGESIWHLSSCSAGRSEVDVRWRAKEFGSA